ncbi:cytochrome P450 [Polyangium sp. 6x1]|uniref:cytochrome P450 family protein n=1 Tax=Polyangium sp. 6x1 TaxID=3042689 RepID=UPI002482C978|nr:cytochrome P450 [Polyangium sp. 6x1]MDI1451329.1 cytochrome P450 [Polyangium sp. 6x1]
MQNGSNGETEKASATVTLSLDPGRAHEDYAAAWAEGPVVTVSFTDASTAAGGDEGGADLEAFLAREHLFVSHYDAVLSALVDGRFSSDRRTAMTPEQREKLPPVIEELRLLSESLLSKDPPDHTRLRKLIQPSFSPRIMEVMRPRIQKLTDDLLDVAERAAEARGERAPDRRMDLIEAFAYPMPVTVISDMLGIPLADRAQVKQWTENLVRADRRRVGGMDSDTIAKLRQFISYLRDLFVMKRQSPVEDMISDLLRAEEAGDKLSEDEVLSTVFLLYLAGHVTTVNLIGNGAFALFQHPTELAKLTADPSLAKGVVEETLRYWGPVDFVAARIAKEDVHLGGARIPKGEPVMVGLAAANRDPARFPNPNTYDITREGAERHVAFGKGIHLCVGAPLARVEGQIAFDTLFRRFPAMRLAVPPDEVRWNKSFLRGLASLPVLF